MQDKSGGAAATRDEPEAANIQLNQAEQLCLGIDALDDVSLPQGVRVRTALIFAQVLFKESMWTACFEAVCLVWLELTSLLGETKSRMNWQKQYANVSLTS
jgi:hypothetical protein